MVAFPDHPALRLRSGLQEQALRELLRPLLRRPFHRPDPDLSEAQPERAPDLRHLGRRDRQRPADQPHVLLLGAVVPGSALVPARPLRRTGPGGAGPAQQRPGALSVAAVHAHRVRAGQDVGPADPPLGHHLGARPHPLRFPGVPGEGMARTEPFHCRGDPGRELGLDHLSLPPRPGDLGVGEMEAGGARHPDRHLLRPHGLRRHDQPVAGRQVGDAPLRLARHRLHLVLAVRHGHQRRISAGRRRLGGFDRRVPALPLPPLPPHPGLRGGAMSTLISKTTDRHIVYEDVSKFYGEVLGVNRVALSVPPGITGLVGPNGSGKTTLMNLTAGLLRPTRGSISVLGVTPDRPEEMFRLVGYSTQYDAFPPGLTGFQFIESFLRIHGYGRVEAEELTWKAIERVNLTEAAGRKVAGYSKGMRQRIKLAQAIAHRPSVLILDEPLNGLDPMARAEVIALFRELSAAGLHVLVSSHILHEVDLISDQVVLIHGGYVVAEGDIGGVRDEMEEQHPAQVLIRCDRPSLLASRVFLNDHVVEARIHDDGKGLLVRTRDADRFYLLLNEVVLDTGLVVETVMPTDADVNAVYEYLI